MAKLSGAITNLSAVTATGAGASINGALGDSSTWVITASSVTTGGTVLIQGSLDGTNWVTLSTTSVSGNGSTGVAVTSRWLFLRANVSARTDGTYTVKCCLWEV